MKDKLTVSNLYSRKWQKKNFLKCYVAVQVVLPAPSYVLGEDQIGDLCTRSLSRHSVIFSTSNTWQSWAFGMKTFTISLKSHKITWSKWRLEMEILRWYDKNYVLLLRYMMVCFMEKGFESQNSITIGLFISLGD